MRVVIAEDSVLLREGLTRLLTDGGFEVAAAVADGSQLLRAVGEHRPDLVVVDVRMPPTHTDEGIQAALVIRRQYPRIAVLVLSQYVEESYPREREVLRLMAEGRSNAGIARALKVSHSATEKYISNIFAKLGLPPTGRHPTSRAVRPGGPAANAGSARYQCPRLRCLSASRAVRGQRLRACKHLSDEPYVVLDHAGKQIHGRDLPACGDPQARGRRLTAAAATSRSK